MKKLVMSFAVFVATYLLLSIEIGNQPLFSHIYQTTYPATKAVQDMIESAFGKGYSGTKNVGKKLFDNSVPASKSISDMAAKNFKAPEESLSEAEKKELNNLIKNYSR